MFSTISVTDEVWSLLVLFSKGTWWRLEEGNAYYQWKTVGETGASTILEGRYVTVDSSSQGGGWTMGCQQHVWLLSAALNRLSQERDEFTKELVNLKPGVKGNE